MKPSHASTGSFSALLSDKFVTPLSLTSKAVILSVLYFTHFSAIKADSVPMCVASPVNIEVREMLESILPLFSLVQRL
jgi:hypothetical protein